MTGNGFDSLAEEDPLRIQEELFVLQGLLQCEALPTGGRFNLVDLGSGSGRLTRSLGKTIAGIMPRERVTIAGLDIDRENIMAGLGNRNGTRPSGSVLFFPEFSHGLHEVLELITLFLNKGLKLLGVLFELKDPFLGEQRLQLLDS